MWIIITCTKRMWKIWLLRLFRTENRQGFILKQRHLFSFIEPNSSKRKGPKVGRTLISIHKTWVQNNTVRFVNFQVPLLNFIKLKVCFVCLQYICYGAATINELILQTSCVIMKNKHIWKRNAEMKMRSLIKKGTKCKWHKWPLYGDIYHWDCIKQRNIQ